MAGFRPGLGLGGMIHSLVVMETRGMAWGGGVGSGLITDAMDILLIGALGGEVAEDGVMFEFGLIERGGRFGVGGCGLRENRG